MAASRSRPIPEPTDISRPFWKAAKRGQLTVQQCGECGLRWWTPKAACPRCLSEGYEWTPVSGRGTLYSWSVVHRAADPEAFGSDPYIVAIVELDEGPHMLTSLVDCDPVGLVADMPVEVAFETASEEISLYSFRPAGQGPT